MDSHYEFLLKNSKLDQTNQIKYELIEFFKFCFIGTSYIDIKNSINIKNYKKYKQGLIDLSEKEQEAFHSIQNTINKSTILTYEVLFSHALKQKDSSTIVNKVIEFDPNRSLDLNIPTTEYHFYKILEEYEFLLHAPESPIRNRLLYTRRTDLSVFYIKDSAEDREDEVKFSELGFKKRNGINLSDEEEIHYKRLCELFPSCIYSPLTSDWGIGHK